MKTGVTMNKCGDVTHVGNHVNNMFKVDGLNLKSEEFKKVRHFLGRASGQSRNGVRRWGKVAISSKSLVVDSGATKTLIKGNNFMKKILNKLKISIKDAVGKIHHSGGHGKLNVKVRDETGNSVELPHLEDV